MRLVFWNVLGCGGPEIVHLGVRPGRSWRRGSEDDGRKQGNPGSGDEGLSVGRGFGLWASCVESSTTLGVR